MLIADVQHAFSTSPKDWMQQQLLRVNRDSIDQVRVTSNRASYAIMAQGEDAYRLKPERSGEGINTSEVRRVFGVLSYLNASGLANPALVERELGFEPPVQRYVAHTRSGWTYTVVLGGSAEEEEGVYARVDVDYMAPPAPERADVEVAISHAEQAALSTNAAVADAEEHIEAAYKAAI